MGAPHHHHHGPHGAAAGSSQDRLRRRAAAISVLVGLVMLGLKCGGYLLTGSAAVLSDAVESVVHVAATVVAWASLRYLMAPPDREHPYGHGRIEHFSVGFEGGLVFLAGLGIAAAALSKLWDDTQPQHLELGMAAVGLAAVINLVLGAWLVRVGRRTGTPILVADGQHVLADVWTSVAVFAGVAAVWLTGWAWIDIALALAIAAYVLWEACRLILSSWRGFIDQADPELLERIVAAINRVRSPHWYDIHGLRARAVGDQVHVDFHLVVPAQWTVVRAHEDVDRLEEAILALLNRQGSVIIHLDHPPVDLAEEDLPGVYPALGRGFTVAEAMRLAELHGPEEQGVESAATAAATTIRTS